jgi:hypothetical protein
VIDHHRRHEVTDRRLAALAAELDVTAEPDPELRGAVCQCVARLADNLKPEYAEALRRIEVDGVAVKDYASRGRHHQQQRRRAGVPGARGAEEAGRALVRDLCRARLPRLHLQRRPPRPLTPPFAGLSRYTCLRWLEDILKLPRLAAQAPRFDERSQAPHAGADPALRVAPTRSHDP